ncbi:MAG: choice-of-anchor D domain-containing protein, partial [Verrucomicrobiaceae bacterium]|nr:choice-of-anchor D domain-containing protein [Verrucomicrobiaceae bacterium]
MYGYVFVRDTLAVAPYAAAPTVTSITPSTGSTAGGTSVTITGTDFTGATGVTIGGAAATSVVVSNDTTITCTTPAGSAGTASVLVTTPGGTNAANTLFTYYTPAPEIAVFDGTSPPAGERTDNVGTFGFGSVTTGGSSAAQTFAIQNLGSATADLTGLAVSSTNASEFTFTAPLATTLAPGATTTFTVTFSPSATGARSGVINIASNDANENPFRINVGGTGAVASVVFTNFMDATTVVGQPNFTTAVSAVSQTNTPFPSACAVSATGKLAVADGSNPRVLIWNSIPTTNGAPADVVIGQTDFTSNSSGLTASKFSRSFGVTFSPDGAKLLVSDYTNHRVLIWNSVPTTNGAPADVVIGQVDFTSNSGGVSATKMNGPMGLQVSPAGKLFVTDRNNHRVLVYNSIPTTSGAAADLVIGQPDMTTGTSGNTANKLAFPWQTALAPDGRLLISEEANNRVVIFNTVPTTNGASADVVIGQTGFGLSGGGTSATRLFAPLGGLSVSPTGQLAIGELGNNRVLIYNAIPTTNGAAADAVLGQPNFTSSTSHNGGLSARSLSAVYGATFTSDGRLLVSNAFSSRVLIYGTAGAPTNTAPTDITLTPSSIAENNAANATVGTLAAVDADVGQTHTFTLVTGTGDTDNGSFTIVGTALKLTPSANYEVKSSYSLRVQANDGNGGTFAKALTVSITDVYEPPTPVFLGTANNTGGGGGSGVIDAPNATATGSLGNWESIRQGAVLSSNGRIAFRGFMEVGTGSPPVTVDDFQGIWKYDGTDTRLKARSGSAAPEAGGALYDMLPLNPSISPDGLITFYGALRIGTGSPPVTASTNYGLWSEIGGGTARLLLREGDPVVSGKFFRSGFTVTTSTVNTAALNAKITNGSALIHLDVNTPSVLLTVVAEEGQAGPGGGTWIALDGNSSDPRLSANGDLGFIGWEKVGTSQIQGIYSRLNTTPVGTSGAVLQARVGGTAPGTSGATFNAFERPTVFNGGMAFRGFLNANGDNAGRTKGQGVWAGAFGALTPVVRTGDTDAQIPTVPAGRTVSSVWSPFSNALGSLTMRVSLVGAGETRAIMGSTGGTMR